MVQKQHLAHHTSPNPHHQPQYTNMEIGQTLLNSSTGSMDADVVRGWLWKKTKSRFAGWKSRFFSLKGALLTYYSKIPADEYLHDRINNNAAGYIQADGSSYVHLNSESNTTPKCVLRVAHVEPGTKSNIALKVYGVCGKILDIRAPTAENARFWLAALENAARLGRRKEISGGSYVSNNSSTNSSCSTLDSFSEEEFGSNFVDKCGWLLMHKGDPRYFVLQGSMLSYHVDDLPWTVPKLRAYVQYVSKSASDAKGLELTLANPNKKLKVTAESEAERDSWYAAVQVAIANSGS